MSIIFILLGALGGTLLLISKMGLDIPQSKADVIEIGASRTSREDAIAAA